MKKLTEYYKPIDKPCEKWLNTLDELIHSDIFLQGVGMSPPPISKELNYRSTRDFVEAYDYWGGQNMWHMPRPWPFQYYAEELDYGEGTQESDFVKAGGDIEKVESEISYSRPGAAIGTDPFGDYVGQKLDSIKALEALKASQLEHGNAITWNRDGPVFDMVEHSFLLLLKSCYMGGIDKSEFFCVCTKGFTRVVFLVVGLVINLRQMEQEQKIVW